MYWEKVYKIFKKGLVMGDARKYLYFFPTVEGGERVKNYSLMRGWKGLEKKEVKLCGVKCWL
jgi:hypothetical protein